MEYPVRAGLREGNRFPNFELPDHTLRPRKLSLLLLGLAGCSYSGEATTVRRIAVNSQNYVDHQQSVSRANYCRMITVAVHDRPTTNEIRGALGADGPFLVGAERRLIHELEVVDTTDSRHSEVYVPYTFIFDRDRTICKVYNGWWYLGRSTVEEIGMDLRALMSRRHDRVYSGK